ncbi:MAG: autotransporter outer membrane beta-barrel domain-containing protein [Planctomycetaceae bacterium]|nr:autotransporter outer membrane beta-barrel domain-containing protein [Planctomycetaceae bacterium]
MNIFIAGTVVGGEFSLQLLDCPVYDNAIFDRTTDQPDQHVFYRGSDKINIVTIIPDFFSNINSRFAKTTATPQYRTSNNRNAVERFLRFSDSDDKSLRTWISGFGSWSGVSGGVNSGDRLAFYSSGFAVGMDRLLDRRFLFGVTFGWDKTTIDMPKLPKENFSAGHGHLYFRTIFRRLYIDVESGIGLGDGAQGGQSGLSKSTVMQWNFQFETGTWWDEGLMKIEPFVSLQHASLMLENSSNRQKTAAIAGVRSSWQSVGLFSVSTPRIYGGLICELGDSDVAASSLFADSPTIFVAQNQKIARTRFFAGCGTTASMGSAMEIYFRYTAEAASHYSSHTLLIGMNWIF